jgi:hypothetical protein
VSLARAFRRCVPASVKARFSARAKARARALLGIEPWPDLAVRHPLFRTPAYRELRRGAAAFDVEKAHKPVLERGHQTSYLVARWFADAGVRTAFHVGYANGRYLFYLSRAGIACGGTDLPAEDTAWVDVPEGVLDPAIRRRMLRADFFDLDGPALRSLWPERRAPAVDVLFSEATFETMLPWRHGRASVPMYLQMPPAALDALLRDRLPATLASIAGEARNMIFIEPEPDAGGTGAVFGACRASLPGLDASAWKFRPPFDHLFRLSPGDPTHQVIYAFTRDRGLLEALKPYAERME